jgi:hypothetical protein
MGREDEYTTNYICGRAHSEKKNLIDYIREERTEKTEKFCVPYE